MSSESPGTAARCADGLGRAGSTYVRRRPEDTLLHRLVRDHLETFLAEVRLRGGGEGVPSFVERELREFLGCGVLARGFARFRCTDCEREVLVAFSCKGRGFCPSCCGRRMAELSAHLVDGVLGGLPVRQWVLTLPYRLRFALAWDHRLCRAVLAVFVRAVLGFERGRGKHRGVRDGAGGAVTAIQRFGSALNTNVHFHTLVAQGVFARQAGGILRFAPAPAPGEGEVARLLSTIRRRIVRLVARHGIDLEEPSLQGEAVDERLLEFPAYAEMQGAAVVGRVATGPRAGARPARLGSEPPAASPRRSDLLHAHLDGFDLHAAVAVPAGDRGRLEHLCRYVLRPPIAQERLELTAEGSVLLHLRRPWGDGTRAIRFEPSELLERLAAMIPKPRINLLLYHGVFAPHARQRAEAVRRAREIAARGDDIAPGAPHPGAEGRSSADGCIEPGGSPGPTPSASAIIGVSATPEEVGAARPPPGDARPRHHRWADLLQRTFAIDVLACPECGGTLRLIATICQSAVIEKILRHLGLPVDVPEPAPARRTGWLPGIEPSADLVDA